MVYKYCKDWQSTKSVNYCTLEDLQGTYQHLQLIGPEEIRKRLQTLAVLKEAIGNIKEGMGSDGVFGKTEKQRKKGKNQYEQKDMLILPKLCPEIYQRSRLTGFSEVPDRKALEDRERSLSIEVDDAMILRKRKKATRRKEKPLCLNCKMAALTEKDWLPQLSQASSMEKRSKKKTDSFVLPEIRVFKNR